MREYGPCVYTVSTYGLKESEEWHLESLDWAEDDRLFGDVFAVAEGKVDSELWVLEGVADW